VCGCWLSYCLSLVSESLHTKAAVTSPRPTRPAVQVLLLTYMRSGSSFAGDVLQRSPEAFYLFEPLRSLHQRNYSTFTIEYANGTRKYAYTSYISRCLNILSWFDQQQYCYSFIAALCCSWSGSMTIFAKAYFVDARHKTKWVNQLCYVQIMTIEVNCL